MKFLQKLAFVTKYGTWEPKPPPTQQDIEAYDLRGWGGVRSYAGRSTIEGRRSRFPIGRKFSPSIMQVRCQAKFRISKS